MHHEAEIHCSDVIMSAMHLKSPTSRRFAQAFVQVHIKENIKALRQKGSVTQKMFPFDDVIM